MKLDNLKIEISQEETHGYIYPSWIVYDSETGKSVKLDKSTEELFASKYDCSYL